MFTKAPKGEQRPGRPKTAYEKRRDQIGRAERSSSAHGREIGPLPKCADPKRRAQCRDDLERALRTYFPQRFRLPFSQDHRKLIAKAEQALRQSLMRAVALPRGRGKTTICDCVVILAVLYAFHLYVALLAATQLHGRKRLETIRKELETNPLLLADFPETLYPIKRLEGINQRAKGQLCNGRPTSMSFSKSRLILPTTDNNPASGAAIECGGLLSAVRGLQYEADDGTIRRPTFVMVDDPQTRRSARSQLQTEERETVINGDVLYLAGPGQLCSGIITCTVIEEDDLADRLLDHDKNPELAGLRTKMLPEFPRNMELWDQYAERLANEYRAGGDGSQATKFYRRRRKKMDAGAQIDWPEAIPAGLASALEHAMRLYYKSPDAFASEGQNDPTSRYQIDSDILDADQIAAKTSGYKRGEVPLQADHLTAFVDVQKEALFYLVAAWSEDFTGWILDYGTWPAQKTGYFTLAALRRTISRTYPGRGLEARLLAALTDLDAELAGRTWQREDGAELQIERALVDANWGESTNTVYRFCRTAKVRFLPAHGRAIGPGQMPLHMHRKQAGDRFGDHWKMPSVKGRRAIRYVLNDVNFWKTFVHRRLAVPAGDPGGLALFEGTPATHRLLAEHLTAEYPVPTAGPWGEVDQWQLKPAWENHWLDCLVGAAAAASIAGCRLKLEHDQAKAEASETKRKRKRPKVTYL